MVEHLLPGCLLIYKKKKKKLHHSSHIRLFVDLQLSFSSLPNTSCSIWLVGADIHLVH